MKIDEHVGDYISVPIRKINQGDVFAVETAEPSVNGPNIRWYYYIKTNLIKEDKVACTDLDTGAVVWFNLKDGNPEENHVFVKCTATLRVLKDRN